MRMNNEDLICLSSSDEDEPRNKKKRIEPIPVKDAQPNTDSKKFNESIICLDSDEDTDSQEVVMTNNKENVENNSMSICKSNDTVDQNDIDNVKELYSIKNLPNDSLNQIEYEERENSDSISNGNHAEKYSKTEDKNDTVALNDHNLLNNTESLPNEAISFLSTCKRQLRGTECASIIYKRFPTLIKIFRDLADEISKSDYFKSFLIKQNKIASESVKGCIISFKDVYQYFKSILECEGIELSKKHWKHLRKLEEVMNKLLEKLRELDDTEVDFDAEDQSSYIKYERYSQRLSKVYAKYCQILKKNPYAGRLTHERLDFVSSHYNEINLAVSKKYKNNKKFPNYSELSSFISEVVKEKKIDLSDAELKVECKYCFEKLGDLLQTRRKKELYEVHCSFIIDNEDPAEKDTELNKKLRISSKEGMVKIEQVCEEYVKKQELGIDKEEIDCSDENDEDEEVEENVEDFEDEQILEDELSEESEENQ
ncbi:hypothetical protein WA026_001005 [Henosepilachna vigintioctopunctata]|uniref:Daxx histone-binding domain-containing protein n=1 Tax=Henosepilachna vigintioctopunctata TaxID=420089 RepID=A0AAW1V5M3_9CUCU